MDSTPTPCKDCGVNTSPVSGIAEFYVVLDKLWIDAHAHGQWIENAITYTDPVPKRRWMVVSSEEERRGFLCVGCLEERLGFLLRADHFKDLPANNLLYPMRRSSRLTVRLMK